MEFGAIFILVILVLILGIGGFVLYGTSLGLRFRKNMGGDDRAQADVAQLRERIRAEGDEDRQPSEGERPEHVQVGDSQHARFVGTR